MNSVIQKNKNNDIDYTIHEINDKETTAAVVVLYCNKYYEGYFLRLSEFYAYQLLNPNNPLMNYIEALKWYTLYNVVEYNQLYYGRFFTHDYISMFFNLYQHQLNAFEKKLLQIFTDHNFLKKYKSNFIILRPFGVVVVNNTIVKHHTYIKKILQHEYSHFLFKYNTKYRKTTKEAIKKIPKSTLLKIKQHFINNEWVYNDDELIAAYIGDRSNKYIYTNKSLVVLFNKIHNEFIKKTINTIYTKYKNL